MYLTDFVIDCLTCDIFKSDIAILCKLRSSQTVLPCAFFFTSLTALCAFIAACRLHPVQLVSFLGAEGIRQHLSLSSILYPLCCPVPS
ncbi:hypothetical protein AOLI_G00072290 [Acnodon oligacanthus]